ncbi:MAG: hypothetical protein CML60_08065 [Rhodobacteraceae bacterium]|nr:hypothetical protein [Paracoccaceae bacterium]MBT26338.1 hypothetical protein [Paracoccaceae bacterium]
MHEITRKASRANRIAPNFLNLAFNLNDIVRQADVDISIGKLLDNFDAYLRIAENQNVLFADERGRRFALVPIARFERMNALLANDT